MMISIAKTIGQNRSLEIADSGRELAMHASRERPIVLLLEISALAH